MFRKFLRSLKVWRRKIAVIAFIFLILAGPIILWFAQNPSSALAWYDTNYGYRKPITLTNNGSSQTNYLVQVITNTSTLISGGKMQADCDDVRFVDTNDTTLLSHWMEFTDTSNVPISGYSSAGACNTTSTVFWVKVPTLAAGSSTIYMYYANASATTNSSYQSTVKDSINIGSGKDGACTVSSGVNINTSTCIGGSTDAPVTYLSSTPTTPFTSVVVNSASGLAVGDEILIINMQSTTAVAVGDTGVYETARITNISGTTLTLNHALDNTNKYNVSSYKTMVQRIPNYTSVTVSAAGTLTANAWNGTVGGAVMFRANGTVSVTGIIYAKDMGFRPGAAGAAGDFGGGNAESFDGTQGRGGNGASHGQTYGGGESGDGDATSPNNGGARGGGGGGGSGGSTILAGDGGGGAGGGGSYGTGGGGGGGNGDNAGNGGGGGANGSTTGGGGGGGCNETSTQNRTGGAGGPGGSAGSNAASTCDVIGLGGEAGSGATSASGAGGSYHATNGGGGAGGGGGGGYGAAALTTLFLGSGGGGSGGSNDGTNADIAGKAGGPAGGIIAIGASTITINTGGSIYSGGGSGAAGATGTGGGGGGSGGSILLQATTATLATTRVTATGGAATTAGARIPGGGEGGDGRIQNSYSTTSGTTDPAVNATALPIAGTPGTEEAQPTPTPTSGPTSTPIPDVKPILYWKFNDASGTAAQDSSSYNKDGTLSGATLPTWQTEDLCVSEKCLYFSGGTSGSVTASNTVSNVQSVSFWVKPATASGALIDLDGSKRITATSGIISATGFTSPAIYVDGKPSITLSANSWQHITITTATAISASSIKVGNWQGNYLKGFMDEVKLYNYTLSAAQVKADFNSRGTMYGVSARIGSPPTDYLNQGLVGYWRMEETATPSTDSSGNGNSGTWTGGAVNYTGKFGYSISSKASGDYVSVGNSASLQITGALTLSAWASPSANMSIASKALIVKNNSYRMVTDGSGNPVCQISDGSTWQTAATSNVALTKNTWQLVTCTYDQQNIKVFVNGTLQGTSSVTTAIGSNTNALRIGSDAAGTYTDFFQGGLDEVRVYNRTLSPTEVRQLAGWGPGPIAEWKFEEKSGNTIIDTSGNGIIPTAFSGDLSWVPGKFGSALKFSGNAAYIQLPSDTALNFGGNFTFEGWINPTSITKFQNIFDNSVFNTGGFSVAVVGFEQGIRVGINRSGNSQTYDCKTTSTPTCPFFTANTWQHVAVTLNGTVLTYYLNGIFMQSVNTITMAAPQSATTWISSANTPAADYQGKMDDMRVFNYARTPKQIVSDMNGGHPAGGSPIGSQVGYWKFDEGKGTTAYNSGNAKGDLNGILSGTDIPLWKNDGKIGKALFFNGLSSYISAGSPDTVHIGNDITLSSWVYLATNNANHDIIAQRGAVGNWGYRLWIDSSGKPKIDLSSDGTAMATVSATTTLSTNRWYHIAGVYQPSTSLTLYIDGVQKAQNTTSIPSSIYYSTANIEIGSENGGATNRMSGMLDEVKLYSGALTADDVKLDYNQGKSVVLGSFSDTSGLTGGSVASNSASAAYCIPGDTNTCTSPVGEWKFEEGIGTSAYNSSGKGNTGTWSGSSGNHYTSGKIGKSGKFNGTNDYVDAGANTDFNNMSAMTISAWIYPTSYDPSGVGNGADNGIQIVTKELNDSPDQGWQFAVSENGGLKFQVSRNTTTMTTQTNNSVIPLNTWQFVTLTWNGTMTASNVHLYLNGILLVNNTETDGSGTRKLDTDNNLYIGNAPANTFINPFIDKLDNILIYNYVRTPSQIAWDYNRGKPVGWWKMDECQGTTVYDSSGNSNNGTITIGATGYQNAVGTCTDSNIAHAWYNGVNGKINYSLNLDGTDDYVTTAAFSPLAGAGSKITDVSWGGWFYSTASATTKTIIEKASEFNLVTNASAKPTCGIYPFTSLSAATASAAFATSTWTHITCTYNGSNVKVYVNGKNTGTTAYSNSLTTASSILYMGESSAGTQFYPGQLDDVRIYNYALTPSQVKMLYNNGAVYFGPVTGSP